MKKDELLQYLEHLSNWALKYHNHKELSSWAVVVLHALLVIGFIERIAELSETIPFQILLTCVLTILTALALILLLWQLRLRSWAADLGAASKRLYARYLSEIFKEGEEVDFDLSIHTGDSRRSTHQFPRAIIDEIDQDARRDKVARFWLASGSTAIIIVMCSLAILILWYK
jgi:hypothetical protein